MTSPRDDIRDIDLMAYADGLLEGDAARKAAVEAYLAAHPMEAARVEAIIQDNEAIRALYAGELGRPVPRRLLRAVRTPARSPLRLPTSIAAGLVLAALAGGGGWLAGQAGSGGISPELLGAVAQHHVERGDEAMLAGPIVAQAVNGPLLSAPAKTVWIEVPMPDLGVHGYELAGRTRLTVGEEDMIRLVYRSPDAALNLFMRLRGNGEPSHITSLQTDGLAVHHWASGPLAYALTVETAEEDAGVHLAELVREAIESARFIDQPPSIVAGEGESVAGDGLMQQQPDSAPPPLQPNQLN